MLIYVKNIKKKTFYGRTDGRTTQNYSSEPHKRKKKKSECKRANQKVKLYKFIVFLTGV